MQIDLSSFRKKVSALPEPENLFEGVRLPEDFELPDEILLFHHDFCAPAPNAHKRYTLVFPQAKMRYRVDQREYAIDRENVLLIRPFQLRFLLPESPGYERFFITFQLQREQAYLPADELLKLTPESLVPLQKIPDAFTGRHAAELALLLYQFLSTLTPAKEDNAPHRLSREISRAVEYINRNIHCPLENREIAEKVNMSLSNMCRRFRREVGLATHEYIARQRLEFAKYYLKKTRMSIDDIAAGCGFGTAAGFCHFFKDREGIPPLQYRRKEA